MNIDRDTISEIVERVLRQEAQTARCNASSCSQNQFFKDVDSAVRSAVEGYRALSRTSIEQRKEYIQAIPGYHAYPCTGTGPHGGGGDPHGPV